MAHILLAEDDDLVASTIVSLLQRAGHEVTLAVNGEVALTQFAARRPDLVITDIIMPEKEGIGTILEIRKLDRTVPIIAYSGGGRLGPDHYLDMAKTLGATEVLKKPFSNETLLNLVKLHLPKS